MRHVISAGTFAAEGDGDGDGQFNAVVFRDRVCSDSAPLTKVSDELRIPGWKRVLDWSAILLAAPVWMPLMGVVALVIKFVSRGPVLFRQERIGFKGRPFACLKFRTMHAGSSPVAHEQYLVKLIQSNCPMTKLDGEDPRLIPLARLLRSTGLDELPQLFNVLRGEMSLVGPRPCTRREFEAYSVEQRARSNSLPGLTGLWQVCGKNHTTFDQMIELDLRYLQHRSLRLDLLIMWCTPVVLLNQVSETFLRPSNKHAASGARSKAPMSRRTLRKPPTPRTPLGTLGCLRTNGLRAAQGRSLLGSRKFSANQPGMGDAA